MSIANQEEKSLAKNLLEAKEEKLTKWKNEPSLAKLKEDYSSASSNHSNQIRYINNWLDNLNITGNAKLNLPKGKSSVQPKLIRKQAEWRFAALSEPFLAASDLFDIAPVSHEDRKAAQQNALVLNNQFQTKIDKVKFIDEYVRAAVTEGTAIIKLGWKVEEKEVPDTEYIFEYQPVPPEQGEQIQQHLQQLMQMKVEEPDGFSQIDPAMQEMLRVFEETQQMVIPYIVEEREITKKVTVENHPEINICDYKNIIIDPTCEGDLDKASFIIHTFTTSLSELKKTGLYTNLDLINGNMVTTLTSGADVVTNDIYNMPDSAFEQTDKNFEFKDKPRKKLTVYEYWGFWDIDGTGIVKPIVASWVGDVLIRLEENPFPDGKLPFVVVPYLPIKNSVYGEPDGALLEDHQKIVGAITRGMLDLLGKSANSQTGIQKNLLDSVNKKKFLKGEDYEYNPVANPQSNIFQHKYPEIPNSALNMIQMMSAEAEALTGVKAFSTGGGITGANLGKTAAGVRGALDAASKREMGILRRLSNGIIKIGRKIIAMNAVFLDEEEVIRVTNEQFITVRRDDLAGNFDLKLTISTAEADNTKAQELAFMLQTMGNNMDFNMSKIILSEIARLRQMPDLAKTIEKYEPTPSPEEQQKAQLELERLQAEIELLKAQAKEAATKGDMNSAKVPVEHARAENLQNEADNKALDFTQKVSGEDFEKELIKNQQKADNELRTAERTKDLDNLGKLMQTSQQGLNNLVTQQGENNGQSF